MSLPLVREWTEPEIEEIVKMQKQYYTSMETRSVSFRRAQLQRLKEAVKRSEEEILAALYKDLNKSDVEAFTSEVGLVYQEINLTLKRLKKWTKPKRVKTALTHIGSKGWLQPEPYGTVLIIAPWNYPFQLVMAPLIGAIAAGNTAVIKPSELTPHVSKIIAKLIGDFFAPSYLAVIEGGLEVSQSLLKQPVDYIFFTGSTGVGKVVMEAAAKQLIPVTLELGGKSPCIVHKDANVKLAAKRIVFGKFMNVGQTCIAPDYLYVHRSVKPELVQAIREAVELFYGTDPVQLDRYGKIVNGKHFNRLLAYLKDGSILYGGTYNESLHKIAPTLLDKVSWADSVMQDEIFGPILPILEYEDLQEVIHTINSHPKPLALYAFTDSPEIQERITSSISFGGGCINDTLMHIATPHLPFGGVGGSGMGSYHGEYSFQTFSHYKSILKQTNLFDLSFRYPSSKNKLGLIKRIMK
ncbi:aldehyde dehydrogenase [Paenibacillus mendelii]|uniref:Aldehyde dehydrogenase n=1 Tax=Paenibacillus mendelii TaxID=206163 RepID=A0ABV6J5N5_9BACL|nr:aldehyde dehydrogenase [Paenibacillus mendelii]MCQ6560095.1 aldehyde dehydrogenase [Paenibacillus mendelii]